MVLHAGRLLAATPVPASQSQPVIRFSHVTKEYPRTGVALSNASFQVAKGEFAFLTGPSGAGKSTILKLVYMEERPTSGEVRVGGMRSTEIKRREIPKLRRRLGIVFQDFRLLEDRTAEQNIAFALEVTGTPRDAIPAKVGRLLTQVGLASKGTSFPRELSGGEQQRVAIARALVNDPVLLIADEPTATSMSAPRAASSNSCATSTRRARRSSWPRTTSKWCAGRTTA